MSSPFSDFTAVAYHARRVPLALDSLWPSEAEFIATASPRRQQEYAGARWCAREALKELGVEPTAILNDSSGSPQWPEGIVGSLTHCRGYQAAALTWSQEITALGLDAEPAQPLPPGVLTRISSTTERAVVASLGENEENIPWDRLLFCVKESIFKAWYPLMRSGLGFFDVEVRLFPTFTAEITFRRETPTDLGPWKCAWRIENGILLAMTWC